MATKLEKNLVRESTIKVDDKEIIVTLTPDQGISMKLKGMRSGSVSIPIEKLYYQLTGKEKPEINKPTKSTSILRDKKEDKNSPMISLNDLRSHNLITPLDFDTQMKFEQIILSVINASKL